jgi:hypothetical protein
MANLRDVNYDFRKVWFSDEAERIRTSIRNKECHCPLANASYTNLLMNPATLTKVGTKVALSTLTERLDHGRREASTDLDTSVRPA